MILRAFFLLLGLAAAPVAQAQHYRWVDQNGVVRYTDTPPPASAKDVRKVDIDAPKAAGPGLPYSVARLQKDFPVTVYTSPSCLAECEDARKLLNARGIPFTEVQVWNAEGLDKLKAVSGGNEVPVFTVGRTVQKGFEASALDGLLDSVGYPKAGEVPARSQAAPPLPEGYPGAKPKSVPKPQAAEQSQPKGPYDTSGLKGPAPKQGPYSLPGETTK
ncbi:MAG TPA: glutaredoxin family protein [Burkholderiales bacterium]|nr:glutaredoxin family protein [Burkholderiales bacterium]